MSKTLFGPCVRYGSMTNREKHPCYFCGYPIPVTLEYCKCGIVKCPKCHNCYCTISSEVREALLTLRNRYCCNPINFTLGVDTNGDAELLKLVPHYTDAIEYCRNVEKRRVWRL